MVAPLEDEEEEQATVERAVESDPILAGPLESVIDPTERGLIDNAVRASEKSPAQVISDRELAKEAGLPPEVVADETRGEIQNKSLKTA